MLVAARCDADARALQDKGFSAPNWRSAHSWGGAAGNPYSQRRHAPSASLRRPSWLAGIGVPKNSGACPEAVQGGRLPDGAARWSVAGDAWGSSRSAGPLQSLPVRQPASPAAHPRRSVGV